jgi:hypothetical protein
MKLISKRTSLAVLGLAIICLILRYALNYWFGYYEMPASLFISQMFFWLIGFLMIPALLITWIISLIQKKDVLWTTMMLIGLLALKGLEHIISRPDNLIIYGIRDRILRDYSLDTLRHFAHDFDQLPSLPKHDLGLPDEKIYRSEDLNTELKEKYPFLTWLKRSRAEGPNFIDESDGVVDVSWGGRPHWGFRVAVNGKKIDSDELDAKRGAKILRASDDIYFIIEND